MPGGEELGELDHGVLVGTGQTCDEGPVVVSSEKTPIALVRGGAVGLVGDPCG